MSDKAGNARDARRKRRNDAAGIREDHAMRLYAAGESWRDITRSMREEYGGTFSETTCRRIVYRGLARRAAEQPEEVAVAREMLMQKAELLLNAHMPLALGANTGAPDVRSAEFALRALSQMAEWLGVKRLPPSPTEINNTIVITPENVDKARTAVLAGLEAERQKHLVVDGQLASVGTSMHELASHEEDDTLGPPPGVVLDEEEAA